MSEINEKGEIITPELAFPLFKAWVEFHDGMRKAFAPLSVADGRDAIAALAAIVEFLETWQSNIQPRVEEGLRQDLARAVAKALNP